MPFHVIQTRVSDVIADKKIDIPDYQRAYVWKADMAMSLIETIMDDMPMPSFFISEDRNESGHVKWLEDAHQRYMTIKKFRMGEFGSKVTWNEKKYADFTEEEKLRFNSYQITITVMFDVSRERREAHFQLLQEQVPLTPGQRFNASSRKPLVKLALEIMKDPIATTVWSNQAHDDDNKNKLKNAMAIASGCALCNDKLMVTGFDTLGPHLAKEFDYSAAKKRLNELLNVYIEADKIHKADAGAKKKRWNIGNITGYILSAMNNPARNWETDKKMFIEYISTVNKDKKFEAILKYNSSASRNYTADKWKQGIWNLDNQHIVKAKLNIV